MTETRGMSDYWTDNTHLSIVNVTNAGAYQRQYKLTYNAIFIVDQSNNTTIIGNVPMVLTHEWPHSLGSYYFEMSSVASNQCLQIWTDDPNRPIPEILQRNTIYQEESDKRWREFSVPYIKMEPQQSIIKNGLLDIPPRWREHGWWGCHEQPCSQKKVPFKTIAFLIHLFSDPHAKPVPVAEESGQLSA